MSLPLDLDWIVQRVVEQRYRYSRHGDRERQNDALSLLDVEQAFALRPNTGDLSGYRPRRKLSACRVQRRWQKPIHIVCGRMDDWLVVVTVYIPTPPKFKNPFERG